MGLASVLEFLGRVVSGKVLVVPRDAHRVDRPALQ